MIDGSVVRALDRSLDRVVGGQLDVLGAHTLLETENGT